ncbi:MAG: AarF/ABC1/UbiB kinase family protein [Verrucomicrobiales bacterium]|nr:AarF/ABC1/UbiB kinase family protein [Verrucomicrobiales bacterium]
MNQPLQRSFQLGLLAKDLVSLKCSRPKGSEQQRKVRRIVDRLGLLHGLPQKIGQLLSFSELNDDAAHFSRLTENEPSLTPTEAFAEIERQLGCPIRKHFQKVDPQGISASIGQVHHAVLHDGREVAIKIQYPGVSDQIKVDLQALGWLTAPIGDLRGGFDVASYRTEIGSMLNRETDYKAEAGSIQDFHHLTDNPDWPHLAVPEVITELSGPRLLVTTWIRGSSFSGTASWSPEDRQHVADTILRLFLKGIFEWGLIHSDPHQGNYRFLPAEPGHQARLGLLDFGCVKRVSTRFSNALARLIRLSMDRNSQSELIWDCFIQMGFNPNALPLLRRRLPEVAAILCEPFTTSTPFLASSWNLSSRLASLLGEHRLAFRTAGPAEILFILRTFQGVLHYLTRLNVPVPWRDAFLECRLREQTDARPEPMPSRPTETKTMKSDALHIQVREAAETKISLSFDAEATDHLEQLVPVELKATLRRRAIDLPAIVDRARRSNYEPGELFSWEEGTKAVRVWLA